MREMLAGLQKLEADGAVEAMRLVGQVFDDFVLGFGNQFCRGGRGGGAEVGDEIGDGEVGFMPDSRNDGEAARCNGAGYALGVEGGQVFEGASAACQDDEVDQA